MVHGFSTIVGFPMFPFIIQKCGAVVELMTEYLSPSFLFKLVLFTWRVRLSFEHTSLWTSNYYGVKPSSLRNLSVKALTPLLCPLIYFITHTLSAFVFNPVYLSVT